VTTSLVQRRARFIEVNPHGLMSAEHGQSQRRVSSLLSEYIPAMAADGLPTIVLLDEVETIRGLVGSDRVQLLRTCSRINLCRL
jgi:hypothetical protein